MDFIAVDFETAQGKRWSICQIGIVVVKNNEIADEIQYLIQPPNNEYFPGNMRIHKIKPEMTEDKPTFKMIWPKISNYFLDNLIICHNTDFDIDCLVTTLEYYKLEVPDLKFECTYKLTGLNLKESCKAYEIDHYDNHDALNDAESCAKLYLAIKSGQSPDLSKVKIGRAVPNYLKPGFKKEHGSVLKKNLEGGDINSPFYDKKVVFTGEFKLIDRVKAAELLQTKGADIDTSVSKKTNFLITGLEPGPSKIIKANNFIQSGCDLKILDEMTFIKLLNG